MCDDEPEVLREYEARINKLGEKHGLDLSVKTFNCADQLFFYMEDVNAVVDIVFLDISMPETDGITAAVKLRKNGYKGEIIFLTKQSDKAIKGYDVQAYHFIVKAGEDDPSFERIFINVASHVQNKTAEYITFQGIGESRNIAIRDIAYFSVNRRIVSVHYGKESFEFYSTMEKVEQVMLEYGFIRAQRSYLVNPDYIRDFTAESITMHDGEIISLSRKNSKQIREAINRKRSV